jgi:hypothetical protein
MDVAHYSKKLEKIGFVTSSNSNTAEKIITLRKTDRLEASEALRTPDWQSIFPDAPIAIVKQEESVIPQTTGKGSKRKRLDSELKVEPSPMVSPV